MAIVAWAEFPRTELQQDGFRLASGYLFQGIRLVTKCSKLPGAEREILPLEGCRNIHLFK